MTNQSEEILNYIKERPGTCIEGIVSGTGWNRHLVEVAAKLMVEQGLVKEVGQTDWLDFRYEAVDRGSPKTTRVEQITAQMESFVDKINQDLQISGPVKLFDPSPFQKAATALSGLALPIFTPISGMIADAMERERLVDEISVITNLSRGEVRDFYLTHPYGLEFIRAAIQAGAKLDEEDIKRTMEERATYHWNHLTGDGVYSDITFDQTTVPVEEPIYLGGPFFPPTWADIARAQAMMTQEYTFIVTLPDNDRREVKAAYMEVDGGTLYFEDDNHDTILAFGPGHWVWAERVEEENASN